MAQTDGEPEGMAVLWDAELAACWVATEF